MRNILATAVGIALVSVSTANAYWLGRVETSASGQSVASALSGNDLVSIAFACEGGKLSFTLQVAAVAAPTAVTLAVSIDGGAPQEMKIADSPFVDRRLKITVAEADAADLASRVAVATNSFAASVVLDGGKTKFEAKQSMTGGQKAIGAVIAACKA